ncbi:hypothetical protein V8E53_010888 [Lactarius tabidus]
MPVPALGHRCKERYAPLRADGPGQNQPCHLQPPQTPPGKWARPIIALPDPNAPTRRRPMGPVRVKPAQPKCHLQPPQTPPANGPDQSSPFQTPMPQLGDAQWAQSGSNQPDPSAIYGPPLLPPTEVLHPALLPQLNAFPNAPKDNPLLQPLSAHLKFTPASSMGIIPTSAWDLPRAQVTPL